jgi:hypothetical protein
MKGSRYRETPLAFGGGINHTYLIERYSPKKDSCENDMELMSIIYMWFRVILISVKAKSVHVQSLLSQEDIIALKQKSGESTITDAIATAVYHYLKCSDTEKNIR